MAHYDLSIARGVNSCGVENTTFPLVCETCLGDNPYMRMTRCSVGKACKICHRPYTSFRWQPSQNSRHKATIICQICAKVKNVCQVCLFDLEYGLPVQVRDQFLQGSNQFELPESQVNRDYAIQNMKNESIDYKPNAHPHEMLLQLARTQPYYKRNRAKICTFWQKGECTRGDLCPYRHETNDDHDPALADQKITNRYMGVNDPLAQRIISHANHVQKSSTSGVNNNNINHTGN